MPSRDRRDVPCLKAEFVARVAAGEAQRAICSEAGMPRRHTVGSWVKADAAFADALAAARRRGHWARRLAFDEGKAAALLARVRAGERVRAVLREPGMPSRATYEHWKATQPPFAEAMFALRQRGDTRLREGAKARWRAFDQALADRIIRGLNTGLKLAAVLAADPELPCRPVLARWRREQPEFDRVLRRVFAAWRAAGPMVPEPLVEAVVDHIVEGGSFASYSRLPGGPARGTLRRWLRDRDFAAAVAQACAFREEWYQDQILMLAQGSPGGSPAGSAEARERSIGRLKRHLVRLRHRPGAVHVPQGAGARLSPERSASGRG